MALWFVDPDDRRQALNLLAWQQPEARSAGSLKITDVRLIDSKLYTCTAENPAGNVSLSYNLHIQAKPRIQPAPPLLKALVGQTVTLPCVVQGEPSPEVNWFHNGLPVGIKDTSPFRIQHVSMADKGTYQCVARNSAGQETLEIMLEILGSDYSKVN
ncbi:myosin light chain kinase, smooth muscle-like [Hippocampus comes]|uniref:myosin light chain kinase, smooth muscle-like n=1 Tax=Hippocampus comes TaxID=109280 RepID=UPI00094E42DE|nr:PREDICTED: myosin light chain kinase, smooth muscle-like [Hippocampus comes]